MKINELNYLLQDIYLKEYDAFHKLYNKSSKVINKLAINYYCKVNDKILYEPKDLVQEIYVELLEDLSERQYMFYSRTEFIIYIDYMIKKTVKRINKV